VSILWLKGRRTVNSCPTSAPTPTHAIGNVWATSRSQARTLRGGVHSSERILGRPTPWSLSGKAKRLCERAGHVPRWENAWIRTEGARGGWWICGGTGCSPIRERLSMHREDPRDCDGLIESAAGIHGGAALVHAVNTGFAETLLVAVKLRFLEGAAGRRSSRNSLHHPSGACRPLLRDGRASEGAGAIPQCSASRSIVRSLVSSLQTHECSSAKSRFPAA